MSAEKFNPYPDWIIKLRSKCVRFGVFFFLQAYQVLLCTILLKHLNFRTKIKLEYTLNSTELYLSDS